METTARYAAIISPLFFAAWLVAAPPKQGDLGDKQEIQPVELPIAPIKHPGAAAEAYYAPDGKRLICNAKMEGDAEYMVYTMAIDGTDPVRINDRGQDACTYYFPDGKRLIWTSTRDCLDLPPGSFSKPGDYPQGSELFTSALDGSDVIRLTHNKQYDAEVSVSPDGRWVLFTRETDGKLDLWKMRPDGTGEIQITKTPDWQEGGAFHMPDGQTIIYRAWKREDEDKRPKPMTIFTIRSDGSGLTQITHEDGTHWAPYPAPDGKHFVFVRVFPPHNFDIVLMNLVTKKQTRLTYDKAFDGYPVISPDGRTMMFSSSRSAAPGERKLTLFQMDVSSLKLGADD